MSKENTSAKRYRNFATVVYPESAPEGWQDALSDFHVPALISPLHDRDVNPGGELKKPHFHVMFMYEGVKTVEQAQEVINYIGGVGCEVVNSIRGYARYLCHMDNPEKVQYDPDSVKVLSGADYYGVISLAIDKYKSLNEMRVYCKDNNIFAFSDLYDYAAENHFDWFRVLSDCGAYVMKSYLKCLEWQFRTSQSENFGDDIT